MSVSYGGTIFKSKLEAKQWINAKLLVHDAGLIVNPHTVMEHIYAEVAGERFLETFKKIYQLKIDNLAQGYSMSSYESSVPSFPQGN